MGFLDRQSRVVDVVLTNRGRELLARGELDFVYYAVFDDGIDYDPWSTGSLSAVDREELIHSSPMTEAPLVPDRRTETPALEPTSFLFKAAEDYLVLPRLLHPSPTGSQVDLRCDQFSSGSSFIRNGTNLAAIPLELTGEIDEMSGFSIHVYSSGSNGLNEITTRIDLKGRRSLDPFVAVSLDEEVSQDDPAIRKRTLRRR